LKGKVKAHAKKLGVGGSWQAATSEPPKVAVVDQDRKTTSQERGKKTKKFEKGRSDKKSRKNRTVNRTGSTQL